MFERAYNNALLRVRLLNFGYVTLGMFSFYLCTNSRSIHSIIVRPFMLNHTSKFTLFTYYSGMMLRKSLLPRYAEELSFLQIINKPVVVSVLKGITLSQTNKIQLPLK